MTRPLALVHASTARSASARPRLFAAASLLAALAAVGGGLGGCESDGPRTMTLDERAASVPMQADEFSTLGYRVEWRGFPTMLPGGTVESVQVLGDALCVTDTEGVFTVLEARSGAQRWSDQAAGPLTRFFAPVRQGGSEGSRGAAIILPSETEVFIYDADTGTLRTKHRLPEVASTRTALVGDALAYGASNGHLVGLLASTGFQVWGSGLTGAVDVDPVVFAQGPETIFASQAGDIVVLDALTGRGLGRSKMFAGPGAPIATSDTLAFIASLDHSLYAVTRSGGQILWRHRTNAPLRQAPAFIDGRLYVDLGESGGFSAFDPTTGKILWQNDTVDGVAVALRNNRLVVFAGATDAAGAAKAVTLDPKNGRTIDTVELRSISMLVAESPKDSPVYAVSPQGVITRLSPR